MKKRILSMLLAALMVVGLFPSISLTANAVGSTPITAAEAVDEMSWGVNLVDLFIAEPAEDLRRQESEIGYVDYTAQVDYDLCIGMWFWDNSFQWVSTYPTEKKDTIQISIPIPDYDAEVAEANDGWAFFVIRCGDKTGGQAYNITLSNCQIIAADGTTVLKDINNFGSNWDGVLTTSGTTSTEGDANGWYWGYGSQENNWTGEIGYFAEWDEEAQRSVHGADPKYNGAHFTATLTVNTATELPTESKAEYYYCVNRTESDYKTLVDTYMAQGVNVFRLPVTWTWFTQNDGEFTIDQEWLAKVKEVVDYILSKGAYCILNTHNDYLQYSYVAESDGSGGYTNFHWEDQWMGNQYKDYVDTRFAAIWTQIANYFKDCSDHLIYEPCNEPAMLWYSGVDYDNWMASQEQRVNELNDIFVNTVRETGGNNATRLLCLAVAEYNIHSHLDAIEIPEDSDYLMIQVHSYNELENTNGETSTTATDGLFADVATFQANHPKIPVIVGEVGISHSAENLAAPDVAAEKVSYFFGKAEQQGVPCLWWEDYFQVPEGGATSIYWIYDKANNVWREEILNAIKQAVNVEDPDPSVSLTDIAITTPPSKTEYTVGESFDPAGMVVTATYSDNSTAVVTGYTYLPNGALSTSDSTVTISYTENNITKTATVDITVTEAEEPCEHIDNDVNHICDNNCGKNDMGTHDDENKDHNCDYGCSETIGTHDDSSSDSDHVCDYGCGVTLEECSDADGDNDHNCDVCNAANVTDHDYGDADCNAPATCSECGASTGSALGHIDGDKDHICDRNCGKNDMGTHADGDKNHDCDYGCSESIGTHADSSTDSDHVCDYGCGVTLEECSDADGDNDHNCDVCNAANVTGHDYGDAECDAPAACSECGASTGSALGHIDENKDHICDRNCGEEDMGTHADGDKDHDCDYGCAESIGTHADSSSDNDHVCDYGCGVTLEECSDADGDNDHSCDVCNAANVTGHSYGDATCDEQATCTECGESSGSALGHIDENKDHVCDRNCGEEDMGTHADGDKDHDCDYGCAESIGTHADSSSDNDHVCDYGCGVTLEECSDVTGDNNHNCDICGKSDVSSHYYGSDSICDECGYRETYPEIPIVPSFYDITVNRITNGDVDASRTTATSGTTITLTVEPDFGYELDTLSVTDRYGNKISLTEKADGRYTFRMPAKDVWVDATFKRIVEEECPGDWTCPMYGYTDLNMSLWYHDGIHYCIEHDLMEGIGNNQFNPNGTTTRAMIVTILWRLEGKPVVNYAMDFEDVESGKWYTEAIRWAASEKIVEGYGNGKFGTTDAITREQMVTIMFRYAQYKGYDVSVGESTNILSYDDAFDVAEWAIPAMQWACGSGMIQGIADGNAMNLAPQGNATRAQSAAILQRFCENVATLD